MEPRAIDTVFWLSYHYHNFYFTTFLAMAAITIPTRDQLMAFTMTGGATAAQDKVKQLRAWGGQDPLLVLYHRVKADGSIESSSFIAMGSLKRLSVVASKLWDGAQPTLGFSIDLSNLAVFEFPACWNLSSWCDGDALDLKFLVKNTDNRWEASDTTTAMTLGGGKMAARILVIPDSKETATMWIQSVPLSVDELRQRVGAGRLNSPDIPAISLPIGRLGDSATPLKSLSVPFGVPEPEGSAFGIGAMALLDVTLSHDPSDPAIPSSGAYREATVMAYREVKGARPTTAPSFVDKLAGMLDGRQGPLRQPSQVFEAWRDPSRIHGTSFCL